MRKYRQLLCAGLVIATSGCASTKYVGRSDLILSPVGQLPIPSVTDYSNSPVPFAIGPNDQLSIVVFGIPEASVKMTVDPSGQISVPIAGSIQAAGYTTKQLEEKIASSLRENHVRRPIVSVNTVEVQSQSITVGGQVTKPGIYAVSGQISLMGAIARAEGTTEFANEHYVVLFRTVGTQQYAALFDLRTIRTGEVNDPQIFPNDEIIVGESRARRIFRDVLAGSGLITTPIVALIR